MTTDTEKLAADIKRVMELDARHKKEHSKWYAERHLCLQADIIRRLTDIVRVQHEALETLGKKASYGNEGKVLVIYPGPKIADAIALSAPLVKEEV
jgi:hypothetical protein